MTCSDRFLGRFIAFMTILPAFLWRWSPDLISSSSNRQKKLSLFSWQSHIDFLFLLLMVLENHLKFLSVALRMCLHCAWCFDISENKLCCLFTYHLLVCRKGIRYDLPDSQWVCLHLPTAPFWAYWPVLFLPLPEKCHIVRMNVWI